MRTFVLHELHGQHLWGIERIDQTLTLRWADPGGAVETIVRRMADVATAVRVEEGLIARRRSEGYRESDADVFPPPSPRDIMENALVEDPDDLAMHRAYADYLVEQGDPHGELIQVQLAIEELPQSAEQRQPLLRREEELIRDHGQTWLGELAPFLLKDDDGPTPFDFGRGWLEKLIVSRLSSSLAQLLAAQRQLRLLNTLTIETFAEQGRRAGTRGRRESPLHILLRSPYLGNVRSLEINHCEQQRGELPLLLDPFALPRLTHLRLQGGTEGNAFCTALVSLGTLERLQTLSLKGMRITDDGARTLAGCCELKRLDLLILDGNRVSAMGLQLLRNTGAMVRVEAPQPRSHSSRQYDDERYDSDME